MSRVLREVDINRVRTVDPKLLKMPTRVRLSRRKDLELAELNRPAARINFHQLQRRLYELLAMDFDSMEEFAEGRALTPQEIEQAFYQHLSLLDEHTLWMLQPLMSTWQEAPGVLVSARIMDVLRLRRMELRKGMETPLQDLLDWLLLSARLGERLTAGGVRSFVMKLGGNSRRTATAILTDALAEAAEAAGCGEDPPSDVAVDVPQLYLRLRNGVRPLLNSTSHFTGRYYTMAFDDLIAMDDAVPLTSIYGANQPEVTPVMRNAICEMVLELAMDERMDIKPDTYFLATTLLDRFLAVTPLPSSEIYLYGAAALVAAAKYEEIYTIRLDILAARFHNLFTATALREAEGRLLTALQVRVGVATLSTLANTMIVEQDPPASPAQRDLLLYIIATLSVRTHFGQYKQSLLAAASVYISRVAVAIPTGEPDAAVREVLPVVLAALEKNKPSALVGGRLYKLFAKHRYHEVSCLPLLQLFEK